MSFTKIRIIIFSIIICAQLFLSFTPFGIQDIQQFKDTYKRDKTKLDFKLSDFHASLKQLEDFCIDHFRGRMQLINANSYLSYFMGSSVDPNQIVMGKDGWFFLGDNTDNVIAQHTGEMLMSDERLKSLGSKFRKVQDHLDKLNKSFLVVLAPNKHTVYKEKLPNGLKRAKETNLNKFMRLRKLNTLNLTGFLLKQKSKTDNLMYYKTDSHWTELGAYLAYKRVCKKLGVNENQMLDITDNHFELRDFEAGYGLTRIIGLKLPGQKQDYYKLRGKIRREIVYKDWSLNTKWTALDHKFMLKNDSKITVYNKNAKNKKRVLFIGDSFKDRMFDYFNNTFEYVSYLHYHKSEASDIFNTIDKLNPDIVIYQIVERNINSPGHLKNFE